MGSLSDVFKYISHFRHAGHQVGRKVGDMLEVLTYAAIARDPQLAARLHVEPKVVGFSGAGHKVEFTILKDPPANPGGTMYARKSGRIDDLSKVIAFVECKKVGVEQTVNSSFKRNFSSRRLPFGTTLPIGFQVRGGTNHKFQVHVSASKTLTITKEGSPTFRKSEAFGTGHRIIFALSTNGTARVLLNTESLRNYAGTLHRCRILDIHSIDASGVTAVVNDCLAGPQTPEKAKQASFVALDVRKKRFGSFDKRPNEADLVSALVLTEATHWEDKSRNMIRACIDTNVIVDDALIVQAFQQFEAQFGVTFYSQIAKDKYENEAAVRAIADSIVANHNGKVFRQMDNPTAPLVGIRYDNGVVVFD
jgi:hypothetical protein